MKLSNWLTEKEIAAIASFPENSDTQLFSDLTGKMTSTLSTVLDSFIGEPTELYGPCKTPRQVLKEKGQICPLVPLKDAVATKDVNMVNILDKLDYDLKTCHCSAHCPCA